MSLSDDFYKKLALSFKQPQLLTTAITHRSYLNEHKEIPQSNERLEFLGDAVLELIVSAFLYHRYSAQSEGTLTALRAKIVQTKTLAKIAKNLGIPKILKMSKGEAESGGRNNESLLADTFEAIIGAIYLDQGLNKAAEFIKHHLFSQLETILNSEELNDYKSLLQELAQAQKMGTPLYTILSESGPDHQKTFTAAVLLNNQTLGQGSGRTKQLAEQQAAKVALEKLKTKA